MESGLCSSQGISIMSVTKEEDVLVDCHGRQLHAELDQLIISDPKKSRKACKKPRYNSESAADMFLRSMEYESEAQRQDAVALGKETKAKELLDSAVEDRVRAKELHEEAARLRSVAASLSPQKRSET
jgi:monoamine oxidase